MVGASDVGSELGTADGFMLGKADGDGNGNELGAADGAVLGFGVGGSEGFMVVGVAVVGVADVG